MKYVNVALLILVLGACGSRRPEMSVAENEALIRRGFEMTNEAIRHAQEHPEDVAGRRERRQAIADLHASCGIA